MIGLRSTMSFSLCWLMVDCREFFGFYTLLQFSVTQQCIWALLQNVRVIYLLGFPTVYSEPDVSLTSIHSCPCAWRQEPSKKFRLFRLPSKLLLFNKSKSDWPFPPALKKKTKKTNRKGYISACRVPKRPPIQSLPNHDDGGPITKKSHTSSGYESSGGNLYTYHFLLMVGQATFNILPPYTLFLLICKKGNEPTYNQENPLKTLAIKNTY